MINDILTNSEWLIPQINILIWLQNFRIGCNGFYNECFMHITMLGELFIPTLVMCIIYWCINTNAGLYLFCLNATGLIVGKLLKMIACIYRPWILSPEIHPLDAALKMSGGYSFPSGHCTMASTVWGGIAFLLRNKKIICTSILLFILFIAFSRMYLGVHTLQDVLGGLFIGFILIFAIHNVLNWCEKDKNRYIYLLGIFNTMAVLSLIYVLCKHYPIDYSNGKILVNPKRGIYISVLYTGWSMGIFNGAILAKRFFPFDAKRGSIKSKILRAGVGLGILLLIFYLINNSIFVGVHSNIVSFWIMFVIGFFITGGYPFIFKKINRLY